MASAVADQLRASIVAGDLPPGARLLQEELAERLAVSRAPVRQALVILEREGLVHTDRWKGAVVAPLDLPHIQDLYGFRGAAERFVAETLAQRPTFDTTPIRAIVEAGRVAATGGDLAKLIDLDLRFHTKLYEAVGNRVLSDVMDRHWTHTRRVMSATLKTRGYPQTAWDEHEAILDAIDAHDTRLAGQRAADHMSAAAARISETFTREFGQAPTEEEPPSRSTRARARGRA